MDFLDIEKIILQDDTRGMSSLYERINKGFIERSTDLLLSTKGKIFICSGFYILNSKSPETDGPPGAISLGKTLEALDNDVYFVTDKYSKSIFEGMSERNKVLEFPIASHSESNKIANDLIKKYNPQLVVSIERAGLSIDGKYRNFRGVDFSDYNAKVDYLFEQLPNSIGIGDGGNEIGMGNYKKEISDLGIYSNPSVITTTENIIASTSNWGAYGLIAGISKKIGKNFLPSVEEGKTMIEQTVELGAVEGMSGESKPWVDGRSIEEDQVCLRDLNGLF